MSGDRHSEPNGIETGLMTFLKASVDEDLECALAAYRRLFTAGNNSLPQIVGALRRLDQNAVGHSTQVRYITGLFSLLHDINEAQSRALAEELCKKGLPKPITHRPFSRIELRTWIPY